MSRFLKILSAILLVSSLAACTVVPAQVGYAGPRVEVVSVRSSPYPYYAAPAPYYAPEHHHHHDHYYRGRW